MKQIIYAIIVIVMGGVLVSGSFDKKREARDIAEHGVNAEVQPFEGYTVTKRRSRETYRATLRFRDPQGQLIILESHEIPEIAATQYKGRSLVVRYLPENPRVLRFVKPDTPYTDDAWLSWGVLVFGIGYLGFALVTRKKEA